MKKGVRFSYTRNRRRILCVFPAYTPSFGTFQHAYHLIPEVRAFMPPQGLLVIAAYLPKEWDVRFIDENLAPATDGDFAWADAVFTSGMHVQRRHIDEIIARAHRNGKVTVLGGPSVSGCPEYYPQADLLHIGELGDATDEIIARLDETVARPPEQARFQTVERTALTDFPVPAYDMVDFRKYLLGSIQFSSGCPFQCEFCDIPELYGRNPRLKTPQQICRELDTILAAGGSGAVYFVDDNLVGNIKALRDLMPHLVAWQKENGFRIRFSCEATLNLAEHDDILAQMREAFFVTVFCGIETPEPESLKAMRKEHNLRVPILDAIDRFNAYGMEVVSGIILGLDTDTLDSADRLIDFIERSQIPMLTINLLYALPHTPLYRRLEAEGRLVDETGRASNVAYKMPYETVLAMWRRVIGAAYAPEALFERFQTQVDNAFANRLKPKLKVTPSEVVMGLRTLSRVLWHGGMRADYRKLFWKVAWPLLKAGRIESVIQIGMVTTHVIRFTRDCLEGVGEAAFYADPERVDTAVAIEPGPVAKSTRVTQSLY